MLTIIFENIVNSLESIFANKLRSSLSMLGIIIGVSSVIILTAIGNGGSQTILSKIQELGTNVLTLSAGGGFGGSRDRASATDILTESLVQTIQDSVNGLDGVAPIITSNGQLVYGTNDMSVSVYGIDDTFFRIKNVSIADGSPLTNDDIQNLRKVAVLGQDIVTELFGTQNPIGQDIKMGNNVFQVVGVIGENSTLSTTMFIPITTASVRITGQKYYSQILIAVSDSDQVDAKQEEIDALLQKVLNVTDANSLPYRLRNQSDMLENLSSITQTLTMLLSGIAAISLLV